MCCRREDLCCFVAAVLPIMLNGRFERLRAAQAVPVLLVLAAQRSVAGVLARRAAHTTEPLLNKSRLYLDFALKYICKGVALADTKGAQGKSFLRRPLALIKTGVGFGGYIGT